MFDLISPLFFFCFFIIVIISIIINTSNFRNRYHPSIAQKKKVALYIFFSIIKLLWRNLDRDVIMDKVKCLSTSSFSNGEIRYC